MTKSAVVGVDKTYTVLCYKDKGTGLEVPIGSLYQVVNYISENKPNSFVIKNENIAKVLIDKNILKANTDNHLEISDVNACNKLLKELDTLITNETKKLAKLDGININ